jgi:hypothetical protein
VNLENESTGRQDGAIDVQDSYSHQASIEHDVGHSAQLNNAQPDGTSSHMMNRNASEVDNGDTDVSDL